MAGCFREPGKPYQVFLFGTADDVPRAATAQMVLLECIVLAGEASGPHTGNTLSVTSLSNMLAFIYDKGLLLLTGSTALLHMKHSELLSVPTLVASPS